MLSTFLPRRAFLQGSLLVAPALISTRPAWGRTTEVTDHEGLVAALRAARGGETILLAPGFYGVLELRHGKDGNFTYESPVTLRPMVPGQPVVLQSMELWGFSNLTFDGLHLVYKAPADAKLDNRVFRIAGAKNITVRNSVFQGDTVREGNQTDIGLPTGIGLNIASSTNILVEDCLIFGFHRGLAIGKGTNVIVRRNELRGIRMDGMVFTKARGVTIEANYIHDFQRSKAKSDHADMIQFWTNGAKFATTDVTIRGNLLFAGPGGSSQSIFMRNDMVDRGLAGKELFYRNVRIEDNVIINGHTHGITLGATDGVVIRNNTLLRNPLFAKGENRDRKSRVPRIKLSQESLNVTVTGNIAAVVPEAKPGWNVAGNLIVQDLSPTQPGYYTDIFRDPFNPDTQTLENYLYLKDLGAGAALLRPQADRSAFRPRDA